jgi:hypothetical protein
MADLETLLTRRKQAASKTQKEKHETHPFSP